MCTIIPQWQIVYNIQGNAEWLGNWTEFELKNIKLDTKHSQDLLKYLQDNGVPIDGLISFSQYGSTPLRWGEVVPLWFFKVLLFKKKH